MKQKIYNVSRKCYWGIYIRQIFIVFFYQKLLHSLLNDVKLINVVETHTTKELKKDVDIQFAEMLRLQSCFGIRNNENIKLTKKC